MILSELATALNSLGLPVAYDHFDSPVKPPYVVYKYAYSKDLYADNINYKNIDDIQIELYPTNKDLASEKLIEDKLKELKISYNKTEIYIDTERLYQVIYDIALF